jgi:hypothetical protein
MQTAADVRLNRHMCSQDLVTLRGLLSSAGPGEPQSDLKARAIAIAFGLSLTITGVHRLQSEPIVANDI